MKRLSGMDAMFLSMEGTEWPQHTLGLMILDPSGAPGFDYEHLRDHLDRRLPYLPQFRRRIQQVPLQLDRPVWVDDPTFKLDYHIHRAALPAPGGTRELADLVGEILARQLDRNQPLWESWFVEGLAGGRVAYIAKTHHSMVDGVSGAGLSSVLCDVTPDGDKPVVDLPADGEQPRQSAVELFAKGTFAAATSPPKIAQYLGRTVRTAVTTIGHLRRDNPPPRPMSAPKTSFNGALSSHRSFAYTSLPLSDVKHAKNSFGVKVNDVILCVVSGALRNYLVKRDALPDSSILATVPMSTRDAGDDEPGNFVHAMVATLCTDVEDPVERLSAIHNGMNSAKALAEDLQAQQGVGLTDFTPPLLLNLLFKGFRAAKLEDKLPLASNLIVSNVPGPPVQLYMAGARIEHIVPVGPLTVGMGINVTVFSYGDFVDVGVQADPDLVEDSWELLEGAAAELERLMSAAG
ncbi:wax ester/triacylglycerol synthase family O-acyltransferase [Mycolicibacterium sp. 050232]|uniref:WS/DGAT/MGAT family O-acyltransferase n=1 Tax=Mycolicibacterium sp. 050232 TaxID=3113982 RepID=UPI002E2C07B5|nr:wax ester/triacylglycerol synthase family O-acyltransferase [Mycolicibacterium sp. 050232]MED5811569.1 wax ester/triacylglycerol synthase family O-acyltransferase [Mycolicibacterium sp. 050232]